MNSLWTIHELDIKTEMKNISGKKIQEFSSGSAFCIVKMFCQ